MKHLFLIIALSFSTAYYSQTETPQEKTSINSKAEYPGGQEVFRNEFMRMVYAYVDLTAYAVNGKFSFIITIDKNGKMSEMKIYPKVKYDE